MVEVVEEIHVVNLYTQIWNKLEGLFLNYVEEMSEKVFSGE